jgi:hypothetical protein
MMKTSLEANKILRRKIKNLKKMKFKINNNKLIRTKNKSKYTIIGF